MSHPRTPPEKSDSTSVTAAIDGARKSYNRSDRAGRHNVNVSRPKIKTSERTRVIASVAEIESILRTWDTGVLFDFRIDTDLPILKCDPLSFQGALLHLLLNARDSMPFGGTVSVRAEAILINSTQWIELTVTDRGVGMTPETIDHAFDLFFTTKPEGMGGVGLPIVAGFARDLGGRVLVESEYGCGTTITLQLPGLSPIASFIGD